MRQAGGAIAGLEQHIALLWRRILVALEQFARLLEGPGTGVQGEVAFPSTGSG
jgi:hypothetical protein